MLGAVLGAAVGDALGHPTEFLSQAAIQRQYGPSGVTGFELWWDRDGRRFAPYTDATQMAEIVLPTLVEHGNGAAAMEPVMGKIAAGFARWSVEPQGGHRAPRNACMRGAGRSRAGVHWREAGGPEAGGCGSVMRDEAAGRHDAGTAKMAEAALADADRGAGPDEILGHLEGWAAHEAIAAAMFVVARHERDLRAALLEGANAAGDSYSIATLAGALLGARLGIEALPAAWVRDVERTEELRLLAQAAPDVLSML